MRIIFMGTPEFAVPSLEILLKNGYEVVAVVTAPDKPGGRQGIQQSAVKQFAVVNGLKILQPDKLKNPEFLDNLQALKADLQIVVAFRMLPEAVWAMPPMGTMNLHGSLLPKYRGAAPINWAVINGETETGLTTFLLKHEIDTGDLLFQQNVPIGPNETAGELHDQMMQIGANLVLKSVHAIEQGKTKPMPQADTEATHAPKIFAETCRINFDQPALKVHNFVRGLSPNPGAWTTLEGKTLKIFRSTLDPGPWILEPEKDTMSGQIFTDNKNYIQFSTSDGFITALELQLEGKKRMLVKDFLNGYKIGV